MDKYNPPYIDDEEREIIDSLEKIDPESLPRPTQARKRELQQAAKQHLRRSTAKMNVRIDPQELEMIKQRAAREGLKYQTLVKSILHKYVTGQLVESEKGSA